MTLMNINALGVTLGDPLFQNLTFTISKGDRIGLVAANGRGKTTLLRCLAGLAEPTTGDVIRARGLRVGYVAQHLPKQALEHTFHSWVQAALPAEQAEYESWRVDIVLDDLSVPHDRQFAPLAESSGGWQRLAMLAAAWITEPDILLLDEPTNHLDLYRLGLLEDWLTQLPRDIPVVITSHDRAFLDATTNRTLFLRSEGARLFQLNYTPARAAVDDTDAADARRFENDLNKARQLRSQAAKLKNIGINSGSDLLITKTKQLTDRAARIEAAAKPAHAERSAGKIELTNHRTHAKALVTLDNVPVETPEGALLYRTGKKWVLPGDRIVLLGPNGTGKTRLLKMIERSLSGGGGPVQSSPSVVPAYSDQHLSQLIETETPLEMVTLQSDIGDRRARSALARAGIAVQLQDSPARVLSGGQRARLAMLLLRLRTPNFYLLDEPTNHLDIEGQEALEAELIKHHTTCLLVSHDRSFLRNVGNRFWQIRGNCLVEVDSPEPFLREEARGRHFVRT